MPIKAECGSCHKRFKAPDKLAGKKVKCPQCGGVIPIPKPKPPKEEEGDTYGLAEEPKAEAPASPPAQAAPSNCPACGSALLDKAVLCVLCGHDLRTGQKLQTQQAPPPPAAGPQVTLKSRDWKGEAEKEEKQKKRKRRKSRGGELPQAVLFLRGLAVSFGSALIGSFMWFGLAYWLDIEMAIIAWILGGLAGVGMMIGYGVEDMLAGLAAAGVALLAIFVAKVMILAAFLQNPAYYMDDASFDEEMTSAEMEAAMNEAAEEEEEAAMAEMADQEMPGKGDSDEGMAPGEEMSEEEMSEEETAAEEAFSGEELPELGMPTGFLVVAALVAGVISMFWPPWNILYLLLACATAYGVGSGGDWFGD